MLAGRNTAVGRDGGGGSPVAPQERPSRRAILGGATLWLMVAQAPMPAVAEKGFGRYIKKKRLDPLETYVPLVLQAQQELLALKGTVADDPAGARAALRTGAFDGVRDNVRALGEYAAQGGGGGGGGGDSAAAGLVQGFFRRLEDFDLILYRAVKDGTKPNAAEAEARLSAATDALAALLATVPGDVLDRSRRVLEAVRGSGGGGSGGQEAGAPAVAAGAPGEGVPREDPAEGAEDVQLLEGLI